MGYILNVWAREFASLLTPSHMTEEGVEFLRHVRSDNIILEENMSHTPHDQLNRPFTISEVEKAIAKS